jgi:putative membrane protein
MDNVQMLIDILGKCERIRKTPMPMAHNYLLKVYTFLNVLILPIGFIASLGYWAVLAASAIYYVVMSIIIIAEEIEEPFGRDPNDLPVDSIVRNIDRNISEIVDLHLWDRELTGQTYGKPD